MGTRGSLFEKLRLEQRCSIISQGSPEKQINRKHRYTGRDLLRETGSHHYGGREASHLLTASWKPREFSGGVPVQTQIPENQRSSPCQSNSESKGTRRVYGQGQEKVNVSAQAERTNSPFFCFFVQLGLSADWCPYPLAGAILFTQCTDSNANLFWTHSEIMFYQLQHPLAKSS